MTHTKGNGAKYFTIARLNNGLSIVTMAPSTSVTAWIK